MKNRSLFGRVDTVILRVQDVEAAAQWYSEKLGLEVIYQDAGERLAVLQVDEHSSLTLWQLKPGERLSGDRGAGAFPILSVGDAASVRDILNMRGVRTGEIEHGTDVRTFRFWDPDGNPLEACQVLTA